MGRGTGWALPGGDATVTVMLWFWSRFHWEARFRLPPPPPVRESPIMTQSRAPEYPVTLIRHTGRFVLHQPRLGLLVSGPTLEEAWNAYREREEGYLAQCRELGLAVPDPQPTAPPSAGEWRRRFWMKSGVALLLVLLPTVLLGAALRELPRLAAAQAPIAFSRLVDTGRLAMEGSARRLAGMSEESREALRRDVRAMAQGLRPVVEELAVLFPEPVAPGSPPSP